MYLRPARSCTRKSSGIPARPVSSHSSTGVSTGASHSCAPIASSSSRTICSTFRWTRQPSGVNVQRPAAREPEVGSARLTWAVDRAAEHGDLEMLGIVAQPLLDLFGELLDADVVAAAAGARDHDRAALAQAERLQDLVRRLDLLDRVGRERDADRVADPVHEERAHADRRLDRARV